MYVNSVIFWRCSIFFAVATRVLIPFFFSTVLLLLIYRIRCDVPSVAAYYCEVHSSCGMRSTTRAVCRQIDVAGTTLVR